MDNPFRATNIHQSRLLWAPNVHKRFRETCFYFLLRLKNPTGDVVGAVGQLLARSLVRSSCIYEVFGYHDVLVRIWATAGKRDRFVQVLEANKNLIEAATEFVAHSIDYRWAQSHGVSDEELTPYVSRIERFCKSLAIGEETDQTELDEFVARGLAYRLPGREEPYIKVYIALTRTSTTLTDGFEPEHVKELLDKAKDLLEDVSIYRGIGFANYLIKGVVSEFSKINELTVTLLEPAIQRYQLRPTTFIVANNDAPQSDDIDSGDDSSLGVFQLEFWLGVDYAALIQNLSQSERESLASVFSEFHRLLGTPFSTILEGLFVAKLKADPFLLGEKLVIIMKIESLLGRFFLDLYKSKIKVEQRKPGDEWFRVVQQTASLCNLATGKHPARDYTLHDYIVVTNKLIADGHLLHSDVEDVLGKGWNEKLEKVKLVRNDFAHGRIFENDSYVKEKWENLARSVCQIGDIYNGLVLRYEASV